MCPSPNKYVFFSIDASSSVQIQTFLPFLVASVTSLTQKHSVSSDYFIRPLERHNRTFSISFRFPGRKKNILGSFELISDDDKGEKKKETEKKKDSYIFLLIFLFFKVKVTTRENKELVIGVFGRCPVCVSKVSGCPNYEKRSVVVSINPDITFSDSKVFENPNIFQILDSMYLKRVNGAPDTPEIELIVFGNFQDPRNFANAPQALQTEMPES